MALLRLSVDGDTYEPFDPGQLTFREAMAVEKATGQTTADFGDGLQSGSAMSLLTLLWLARRKGGESTLKFSDVDGVIGTFAVETVDEDGNVIESDADEDDTEPDPTEAAE